MAVFDGTNLITEAGVPTVAAAIETTRAGLEAISDAIEVAVDQSTFGAVTQGARALKNVKKALKLATKGKAIADKQANGAQKFKPINKKANQALRSLQLAFAQLAGFRSNSFKRVGKSGFLPFL